MGRTVNWGSIFAGALAAFGSGLVVTYVIRAVGLGLNQDPSAVLVAPPDGFGDVAAGLFATVIAFGSCGVMTTLIGRFAGTASAVLHSLAALSLIYGFLHLFQRGALFAGRPGFPLDLAFQIETTGPSALTFWIVAISSVVGVASCVASSMVAQLRSARMYRHEDLTPVGRRPAA